MPLQGCDASPANSGPAQGPAAPGTSRNAPARLCQEPESSGMARQIVERPARAWREPRSFGGTEETPPPPLDPVSLKSSRRPGYADWERRPPLEGFLLPPTCCTMEQTKSLRKEPHGDGKPLQEAPVKRETLASGARGRGGGLAVPSSCGVNLHRAPARTPPRFRSTWVYPPPSRRTVEDFGSSGDLRVACPGRCRIDP
jgi:hypothetical protein